MGLALFLTLHVLSFLICFFATRSTFRYLSKHRVVPQQRYTLFQVVRIRHIGLLYMTVIFLITVYAFGHGFYLFMN